MKKRLVKFLFVCFLLPLLCGESRAQGKADILFSGRSRGTVDTLLLNNVPYVELQKTARRLGAGIELFARSKQAKVSAKGFYAILTAPLEDIILNARPHRLNAPVMIQGSKIMVPVEFFLMPAFQKAVGYQITWDKGRLLVERQHNLTFVEKKLGSEEDLLIFEPSQPLDWKVEKTNKHTALIRFSNATFKRDEFYRLKTPFISSADIRQTKEGAQLKVILGKESKDWSFSEQGGKLIFRSAAKKGLPVLTAAKTVGTATESSVPEPSVKGPSSVNEKPSVLTDADFEEMSPVEEPVKTTVMNPVQQPAQPTSKPIPVMKPEPNPLSVSPARKKMRIMIDPGHGGKDPGAVRGKYREKAWNLAVAKELYNLLNKADFEVRLTRDDDTFIALSERSKQSNQFKADLFVSIHTNASKNRNAHGFQVYFRSEKATDKEAAEVAALENEAMEYEEAHYNFVDVLLQSLAKNEFVNESSKLAGHVRNAVYKQPGIGIAVNQNNSVRQANFYVLKGVQSPAILVEMGYISHSKDRSRLSNAAVRKNMAKGIYSGIRNYAKAEGWIK